MKQIVQCLRDGETQLWEVPCPSTGKNEIRIQSVCSLVSLGTEKMLIDFGRSGWISKAKQQPEKVRQVFDKIKTDGISATLRAVSSKLDTEIPLGYSNVGRVVKIPDAMTGLVPGDLVVSNGPHAEVVSIPRNLVARIPDVVKPEQAVFTVVGSIGLQGIRLLSPSIGEVVAVTGLGLIGLLAVQILRAQGCTVIGIDLDPQKCRLAESFGATAVDLSGGGDPIGVAKQLSNGKGVDGVLITASTRSNQPIHQAAVMCRKRGRIVLVGVAGLELSRADFYEKELSFQVSCSYGPGRYDPDYEEKGNDYPYGFVRWTEQRNFQAVLELMARGDVDVKPLISHRFAFSDTLKAYEVVESGKALGIVLEYGQSAEGSESTEHKDDSQVIVRAPRNNIPTAGTVALVGAGGFSRQVLVPALLETGCRLKTVVSSKGVSGTQLARRYGFESSSTDVESVLEDAEVDTFLITTRHDSHAHLVVAALKKGKKVYVEKPLCMTREELDQVCDIYSSLLEEGKSPFLMVGFNRRFAPQIVEMKRRLENTGEPLAITMIVNAGSIACNHWTQDPAVGGGRIVGEACHFIDLARFLASSSIAKVDTLKCERSESPGSGDTVSISLKFENGSVATIQYLGNGHRSVPKERIEVFGGGRVLQLDNFRRLKAFGWKGFKGMNLWRQDKGHGAEMKSLMDAVREGKASPIPFDEIVEVTRASFQAAGVSATGNSDGTDQ